MTRTLTACGDDGVSGADGGTASTGSEDVTTSTSEAGTDDGIEDTSGSGTGGPPEATAPDRLAAGAGFSCELDDAGAMRCWGAGNCGQLGHDSYVDSGEPLAVAIPAATSVTAGHRHACAIADDGSLWCWGEGDDGQIGVGPVSDDGLTDTCRRIPVQVGTQTNWVRVSAGESHTCAIDEPGSLWCWGNNFSGQLGLGERVPSRAEPTQLSGGDWVDVQGGWRHSCALGADGSVWCWGTGSAAGGSSDLPQLLETETSMVSLIRGPGLMRTCAVDVDGGLWCWGAGDGGALGTGDSEDRDQPTSIDLPAPVSAMSGGGDTTCAVGDEDLWCWGSGRWGQLGDGVVDSEHGSLVPVAVAVDAQTAAVGGTHVCVRGDDGETRCWGANNNGEIGDGTSGPDNVRTDPRVVGPWGGGEPASDWDAIVLGGGHGCGQRDDAWWCWGSFRHGELGIGPTENPYGGIGECAAFPPLCAVTTPRPLAASFQFSSVAAAGSHTCALEDGVLSCWGSNESGQLGIEGSDLETEPTPVGTDWLQVTTGFRTSCGIRGAGTLWCWGRQIGQPLGRDTLVSVPTQVGTASDWASVALGEFGHACALKTDATLWCWGFNSHGQAGSPPEDREAVAAPQLMPGSWAAMDLGSESSCAIAMDGRMHCWGRNDEGELATADTSVSVSVPSTVGTDSDWAEVGVGTGAACGRRTDGTVWCWGRSSDGATGQPLDAGIVPPTLLGEATDWTSIDVVATTACGRRSDGSAWCWGSNGSGQQGNDTVVTSPTPRALRDDN